MGRCLVNNRLSMTVVVLGLCAAISIWLIPLRSELAFWRPPFVLLLVIYWLFRQPQHYGLVFAWLVGLGIDFMFGEILGQHALAMSVAAYLVISQQQRTHYFKMLSQCGFVAIVVLAYEVVLLSSKLLIEDVDTLLPSFYSVLTSALLWPALFLLLQKTHREQW